MSENDNFEIPKPREQSNTKDGGFHVREIGSSSPLSFDKEFTRPSAEERNDLVDDNYRNTAEIEELIAEVPEERNPTRWIFIGAFAVIGLVLIALFVIGHRKNLQVVNGQAIKEIQAPKIENPLIISESLENEKVIDELGEMLNASDGALAIYETYENATDQNQRFDLVYRGAAIRENFPEVELQKFGEDLRKAEWKIQKNSDDVYGFFTGIGKDFDQFNIFFRFENGDLKIDWKGSEIFSSASFQQLSKGEGDTREIRAIVSRDRLHSQSFPQKEFSSYLIASASDGLAVWGYVPKVDSTEDELQKILPPHVKSVSITLRLKKGYEGLTENQWIIDDVIRSDWLTSFE